MFLPRVSRSRRGKVVVLVVVVVVVVVVVGGGTFHAPRLKIEW